MKSYIVVPLTAMPEKINILLADDDTDDHAFFHDAIKQVMVTDPKVSSVYDGSQLLEYLFKTGAYKDSKEPKPDMIVLDLNMPRIDGLSALRTVKSINSLKSIPVFILSTSKDETMLKTCKELGCSGYYTKGTSIPQLKGMIEDMLYRSTEHIS